MPPIEAYHPLYGKVVVEPGEKIKLRIGINPIQVAMLSCDSEDMGGSVINGIYNPDTDKVNIRLDAILRKGDIYRSATRTGHLIVKHVLKRPDEN